MKWWHQFYAILHSRLWLSQSGIENYLHCLASVFDKLVLLEIKGVLGLSSKKKNKERKICRVSSRPEPMALWWVKNCEHQRYLNSCPVTARSARQKRGPQFCHSNIKDQLSVFINSVKSTTSPFEMTHSQNHGLYKKQKRNLSKSQTTCSCENIHDSSSLNNTNYTAKTKLCISRRKREGKRAKVRLNVFETLYWRRGNSFNCDSFTYSELTLITQSAAY